MQRTNETWEEYLQRVRVETEAAVRAIEGLLLKPEM